MVRYVIKNMPLVGVIEETSHTTHYLISHGVACEWHSIQL